MYWYILGKKKIVKKTEIKWKKRRKGKGWREKRQTSAVTPQICSGPLPTVGKYEGICRRKGQNEKRVDCWKPFFLGDSKLEEACSLVVIADTQDLVMLRPVP